jgi:hypothetical protein
MRRVSFLAFAFAGAAACSSTGLFDNAPPSRNDQPPTSIPTATVTSKPPPPPPPREVGPPMIVDLGQVILGVDYTVDVPPGALGFTVALYGSTGETVGIEEVRSPSGIAVHADFTPVAGDHQTSLTSEVMAMATVAVPMNELAAANPPTPGAWKVRFGRPSHVPPDGGGGAIALRAEARIQVGPSSGFAGGRLDLDVHLPEGLRLDGRLLDSKRAPSDNGIKERVDSFYAGLEEVFGLDRGDVRFHDAPAALTSVDTEAKMLAAFGVSEGLPAGQSLHVVLTTAIDMGGGDAAWGVAPGAPGAPITTGTAMSGVVLAIGEAPADADGLALLHEAGHFFGLVHTTELNGQNGDPLSDTPRCSTIADPIGGGLCPDGSNVMFPAFFAVSGLVLESSPSQRRIFQGSPVYKAYTSGSSGGKPKGLRSMPLQARTTLTPAERWLAGTICRHARSGAGPSFPGTRAELVAAAQNPDLPGPLRRRAAGLLAK